MRRPDRALAALGRALDWDWVGEETGRRSALEPGLALDDVYSLIVAEARSLLGV